MQTNRHAPGTLSVSNLECLRGDETVLQRLSFNVSAGEILQVLGANGSGKTSLLRILSGLARASDGELQWGGRPLADIPDEWRQSLLYVSHAGGVTNSLTAEENLRFAVALAARPPLRPLDEALAAVGLAALRGAAAGRLSAGQRQRVALARLLLIPAEVWLLDEPLTALDTAGKALVESMLCAHAAQGGLAIVATHQALDLPNPLLRTLGLAAEQSA